MSEAPHKLQPLAEDLGVSVESLLRLNVMRHDDAWHYPERDAAGQQVGTNRRYDDGRKRATRGSKRGLCYTLGGTYAIDTDAGTAAGDPVLVVEGMTDTAAGMDLGFVTVGRSTAKPGKAELAWLAELLSDRHVGIIAEHDDSGVGMTGAAAVAQALHSKAASVKIVEPPADVKYLRTWVVNHGCDRAELDAAIRGTDIWTPEAMAPSTSKILRRKPVIPIPNNSHARTTLVRLRFGKGRERLWLSSGDRPWKFHVSPRTPTNWLN